jgi:hypothetical protein
MGDSRHEIRVDVTTVTGVLIAIATTITALSIAVHVAYYRFQLFSSSSPILGLLDMNGEVNLPTFFSVLLLLGAAALLAVVAWTQYIARKRYRHHWTALSLIFLLLASDEFMQLHERVSRLIGRFIGVESVQRYFLWLIPAGIVVTIVGFLFLGFFLRLRPELQRPIVLAAVLYLGGAMGLEAVASWHLTMVAIGTLSHTLLYSTEELLEMLGVITLIYALLQQLGTTDSRIAFRVVPHLFPRPAEGPGRAEEVL